MDTASGSSSIYQSVSQLKKCFPEGQEQTLLSNVSQVFFGINRPADRRIREQPAG